MPQIILRSTNTNVIIKEKLNGDKKLIPEKKNYLIALFCIFSMSADAQSLVSCVSENSPTITISLNSATFNGIQLSCIRSSFIYDMTPCSPNGGYSLSRPTGSADIVQIVWRWQEFAHHLGGVVSFSANESQIYFSGGFNDGHKFTDSWSINIDRISGIGFLERDKQKFKYECDARSRKF